MVVLTFIPDPDGGAFCLLRVVLNALGKKPCGEIAFDAASHKINIELAAFGCVTALDGGFQILAYGGRQRLFSARAAASASSAAGRRTGSLRFSRFLRSTILVQMGQQQVLGGDCPALQRQRMKAYRYWLFLPTLPWLSANHCIVFLSFFFLTPDVPMGYATS